MRRLIIAVFIGVVPVAPAHAQWVVIDPGNLAQAILIAERTLREYDALVAQYQTIQRIGQGLGDLNGYRVPNIGTSQHDVDRWTYGSQWLQMLNTGDIDATAYTNATRQLALPEGLESLSPAARRAIEQAYATIEITDSVARTTGQDIGRLRTYRNRLQQAVAQLESDVVNASAPYHEMTAVLDKVAAAELVARRQDMVGNQLLAATVEQLIVRAKRMRDAEAVTMNMRLTNIRDGRAAGASVVAGAGDDLRAWRQP
jgi:conjugal transfer/entry exclusion protein